MKRDGNDIRKLLRQLLSGERPKMLITVLNISDSVRMVSTNYYGLQHGSYRHLLPSRVEAHIEQIKSEHLLYQIKVNQVSREECEAISKRLEEEY